MLVIMENKNITQPLNRTTAKSYFSVGVNIYDAEPNTITKHNNVKNIIQLKLNLFSNILIKQAEHEF